MIKGLAIDMDGTVYLDQTPIPGAFDFIHAVEDDPERDYIFFTNNTTRVPSVYVEKLAGMGFTTFEKGLEIRELPLETDSLVLLEDVSNLLVNHIFVGNGSLNDAFEDICAILDRCRVCIAVTISRFDHVSGHSSIAASSAPSSTRP